MAEEFLRIEGGALACFSPVAYGYTFEHLDITENFLDLVFLEKQNMLGFAAIQAKTDSFLNGVISDATYEQYLFFGDPATVFKTCEFYLSSPADRSVISQETQFSWVGDGFTRFLIQFSPFPDFSSGQTLPVISSNNLYQPGPLSWKILKHMASRYNVIFWRVGGVSDNFKMRDIVSGGSENIPFTEPFSFTIK
jgi:hypothetical protein